jgi:tripartite-type tricarboxylate transporter receptor subunit TctC
MTARRRGFALALVSLALASLGIGGLSHAQDYPSRFIRVIVGPGPDITARLFGAKVTEVLGQQLGVESRPGAGGTIAAQAVAGAPSDGYTLLLASASYTINTALGQSPLDLGRDFAPIALVATVPFVLVVHPALAAKSLGELVALAKANPGKLNYASSGIGTPPHLAGELFKSMAGVDIVHVPFREANAGLNAVVSGSVEMMFSIASTAVAQMSGGTVRGIGVTSLTASPLVPGLSSIAQSGLAGFTVIGWNGFVAPKGVSPAIIGKLNAALQRGLDDPELRQRLAAAGYESATPNSPDDFARFIQSDTAKWIALVKQTNMKSH